MPTLIVTAVDAELRAVRDALPGVADVEVLACGGGAVEAAVTTARALAGGSYDLVISAGVGGGFAPLGPGDVAVAAGVALADLGAEDADGTFLPAPDLGFGTVTYGVAPQIAVELADRTGGHLGTVLTVSTATGTAARAADLQKRFPDAVAEAMEGAGVAAAAHAWGVAFAEVRAVSNVVGPRDRDAWRLGAALDALGTALAAAVGP